MAGFEVITEDVINIPPVVWTLGALLGGLPAAETRLTDQQELIRKISSAKEVWVTVFEDGRHSVLLTPKQLAVFGLMLERYDSIEPK